MKTKAHLTKDLDGDIWLFVNKKPERNKEDKNWELLLIDRCFCSMCGEIDDRVDISDAHSDLTYRKILNKCGVTNEMIDSLSWKDEPLEFEIELNVNILSDSSTHPDTSFEIHSGDIGLHFN